MEFEKHNHLLGRSCPMKDVFKEKANMDVQRNVTKDIL